MGREVTREEVVAEAKKYLGVPFVHQGRSMNGVDCVGLIVCIANGLNIEVQDLEAYHRTPSATKLREMIDANIVEIPIEEAGKGDFLLMRTGGLKPRHMAVIIEDRTDYEKGIEPQIIHAVSRPTLNRVTEENLAKHRPDIVAAFRIEGLKNERG